MRTALSRRRLPLTTHARHDGYPRLPGTYTYIYIYVWQVAVGTCRSGTLGMFDEEDEAQQARDRFLHAAQLRLQAAGPVSVHVKASAL